VPRLVDGDNLLGSWPGRDRSSGERRSLARQVASLAREMGRSIVLVFDGPPPPEAGVWPEVLFSGPRRRADDLILDLLRQEADPRGWTVVTNDRSLGDRCRHAGAKIERCDVFRERLVRVRAEEKPDKVEDVQDWLRVFKEED
jgi:hypothetical protein